MSVGTKIEWAEATWNCLVGCTPVSAGCLNCYAAGDVWRHSHPCKTGPRAGQPNHPAFVGLTVKRNGRAVFNGQVRMLEDKLTVPLKRKKATRWFVNSLSDLFHESVPFEFIDRVMAVAALCPQHQFLVLTKRAERMAEYLNDPSLHQRIHEAVKAALGYDNPKRPAINRADLPLPNVWLGTSCEDQAAADARIPHLLRCPAAVRFLSCEPLLGPIDLALDRELLTDKMDADPKRQARFRGRYPFPGLPSEHRTLRKHAIDWVIVGGESGHGARACTVEWVRSIVGQCRDAGVACFVKQLGAKALMNYYEAKDWYEATGFDWLDLKIYAHGWNDSLYEWKPERDGQPPTDSLAHIEMRDRKGGNPDEWPEDLRVREMPGGEGNRHQALGNRGEG
jgi:protein gp37